MKITNTLLARPSLRGLVLGLAVTALASYVARAVPYASGISNNGNTVYFILNQNAQGVTVLRDGANAVSPGTTAGEHNFDMTGFSSYQIIVTGNTAKAWTQYVPDGPSNNFYVPQGTAINKNPASTNFGKVYMLEGQGGLTGAGRTTTSGVYVLRADGADLGYKNGGFDWAAAGNSAPYRGMIGPDDHLYVSDYSNDRAYEFNADFSVVTQILYDTNKTTGQYCDSLWVEGTQAGGDRVIYTVDSHYLGERRGLIKYELFGNDSATDTGTQWIGPTYYDFYPYDVSRDSNGDWYLAAFRGSLNQQAPVAKFAEASCPSNNTPVWEADIASYYGDYGLDTYEAGGIVAYGMYYNGNVYIFKMSDGSFVESFAAGSRIRDVSFDIAGNLVTVDNLTERCRFWSPGGYTVATTKSDGTFTLEKPSIDVNVTTLIGTTSMDTTQPAGWLMLTRTGDTSAALPVGYTLTGTATNGVQYTNLSGTVTFGVGFSTADVFVQPIPYTPAGPTRSVTLSIDTSPNYSVVAPSSGTVWIVDTNFPSVHVTPKAPFYERTNDYGTFTLTRWGDTNTYVTQVNVTYGGTATAGTHFYGEANTNMNYGEVTKDIHVLPIYDGVVTGPLTVTATVGAPTFSDYVVGSPSTSDPITRVDSDYPPENVIWSDNLQTDTSANWTQLFATTNDAPYDATVTFAYDYYASQLIPSAPLSGGDTHGLYIDVNKNDGQLAAAAINMYPNGQSFSGNYALRFNMYLIQNDTSGQSEYALFGLNHDGTHTNWFRDSTGGFAGVDPVGWNFDGVFYSVESDGAALGDYVGYSAPFTAGNPTPITPGVNAYTLRNIFKTPPWTPGAGYGGAAANIYGSGTPMWADVELSQVDGVISYSINHTLIFAYTNTTGFDSGNIMLGMEDGWDSIGSAGGAVIYANARVIALTGAATISSIVPSGANVDINYTGGSGTQFVLLNSSAVTAPLSGWSRVATNFTGSGTFSVPASSPSFYSIKSE